MLDNNHRQSDEGEKEKKREKINASYLNRTDDLVITETGGDY